MKTYIQARKKTNLLSRSRLPPGKTQSLRNKITTFVQYPTETISEAFKRFNEYTRAVPHHKFPKEDLVQKLYQGLTMASRTIIDASAGGSIIELTPMEAFTPFKKVMDSDTRASSRRLHPVQPTGNVKGVLQVEKDSIPESKIDSLMRRLEKMEIEKKEAQDLKAAEARSTCEECREYGHVHKDCPEETKVPDYMRKGVLPNLRYGQCRPQFNASSSIPNSVPLRIQLKEFMDEHAKINKDTVTKFKTIHKVLENIDSKVTEVESCWGDSESSLSYTKNKRVSFVARVSMQKAQQRNARSPGILFRLSEFVFWPIPFVASKAVK
jgi:hypothetical protein